MKQQITISVPPNLSANRQKINVNPWIVVKSNREKNKLAYPPVIMPREHHGYIKPKQFDFL